VGKRASEKIEDTGSNPVSGIKINKPQKPYKIKVFGAYSLV